MKKSIIIWAIALVLVVIAVFTVNRHNSDSIATDIPPAATPTAAPEQTESSENEESENRTEKINLIEDYDFTLEDLEGNKVSLSDYKGKKIFINFWATWCPPCKAEMPDIEKLYQETKDGDLVVLAINIGDDKKTVQDFISKNNYNFKVLLDIDSAVGQMYQVSSIPTSYFVDTEGNLDDGRIGSMNYETMKAYVNNLK